MNNHYEDIRNLIDRDPIWFDENAVPRYCRFSPREVACIYADEIVLALIRCQNCQREFHVAFSSSKAKRVRSFIMETDCVEKMTLELLDRYRLANAVKLRTLHYGDPPNVSCCPAGPSMNSEMIRVVQFWKSFRLEWKRVHALEVSFE